MLTTGVCPILLDAVKARMDGCAAHKRVATLAFDAMSLTEALRYHEHLDLVMGFEDVGATGRTAKITNQALVGVLRGVVGSWKLPIAYYLIRDNPSQARFEYLVNECLTAVHKIGLDVHVLACDQERTQWAWLKTVGVKPAQLFFNHPITKKPVYVVPDPPHCLKNARNALRKNDIMYEQGKFARWSDFVKLVNLECSRELRVAPKLSREHVELLCEADDDHLLVSFLEKATSDCRAGRAHRAATTATALLRLLVGDGVELDDGAHVEDDDASEDDVSDDNDSDDDTVVENSSILESEQQVLDRVGGYVVTRLGRQRKLRCADCRAALLSSSQGILVQERQYAGTRLQLAYSGASLPDFLRQCELCFRQVVAELHCDNIGEKLRHVIAKNTSMLQCCHPAPAAAAIIELFLRVRLHHCCKLRTQAVRSERQAKRKADKVKKLNVM